MLGKYKRPYTCTYVGVNFQHFFLKSHQYLAYDDVSALNQWLFASQIHP